MQHELKEKRNTLSEEGLVQAEDEGWARQPIWAFNRDKALIYSGNFSFYGKFFRNLKEWDYYSFISQESMFGICLTLADLGGIASIAAITFLDFRDEGYFDQADTFAIKHRIGFDSESLHGNVSFCDKKVNIEVSWEDLDTGLLVFSAPFLRDSRGNQGLAGRISVKRPSQIHESMNMLTSWGQSKRQYFYLNQKINCIHVLEGSFTIGGKLYRLNPEFDYGALDWGRGVWTYQNDWFWSSLSATLNGKSFGLNLGYGFSDRSSASENCIIYDGVIHKLKNVEFKFNQNNYLDTWRLEDEDGRIQLTMQPILDRHSHINLFLAKSVQHQVFGRISGRVTLETGDQLMLDDVLGFAEYVVNWW